LEDNATPAWRERGLLVAFTERGDLTIFMFLYDILIAIEYLEMHLKIKRFNQIYPSMELQAVDLYASVLDEDLEKKLLVCLFFPF
jgi:hypothetical protein